MTSPAGRLLWEFCHEVIASQEAVKLTTPAWVVVNLDTAYLLDLCALLKGFDYSCSNTVHHGQSGVIARFEHELVYFTN